MSDDTPAQKVGLGIRFIREWREPTPAEEREDLARFAMILERMREERRRESEREP